MKNGQEFGLRFLLSRGIQHCAEHMTGVLDSLFAVMIDGLDLESQILGLYFQAAIPLFWPLDTSFVKIETVQVESCSYHSCGLPHHPRHLFLKVEITHWA